MNADNDFFQESTEQSRLKSEIVSKYFTGWSSVIASTVKKRDRNGKVGYIDLYAGPGSYEDGTKSTPLLILEKAIGNADLQNMLVTIFSDIDESNCQKLRDAIKALPGIDKLKYPPQVHTMAVSEEVIKMFSEMNLVPSLIFLDPWGYKGLCLDLVNALVKDWACDCVFFFNYRRINAALENPKMTKHMEGLFGPATVQELRKTLPAMQPHLREQAVLDKLMVALKGVYGKYVLKFRFRSPDKEQTSHYLIFVTKGVRGYEIMKAIMGKASSSCEQDVPTYEHDPDAGKQGLLFSLCKPMDCLIEELPRVFAGRTMRMKEVFEQHNVGTRYLMRNYKTALGMLEAKQRIWTEPPADQRKAGTFGDEVKVTFAKLEKK